MITDTSQVISQRERELSAEGYQCVGVYDDRKEALEMRKKLKADGYRATCVTRDMDIIDYHKTHLYAMKQFTYKLAEYKGEDKVRTLGYSDNLDELKEIAYKYKADNPEAEIYYGETSKTRDRYLMHKRVRIC